MSRKNLLFMQINRKFKKMRGLILSQKCSFNAQGIYSLENVELQNVHPGKRPYSAPSFHKWRNLSSEHQGSAQGHHPSQRQIVWPCPAGLGLGRLVILTHLSSICRKNAKTHQYGLCSLTSTLYSNLLTFVFSCLFHRGSLRFYSVSTMTPNYHNPLKWQSLFLHNSFI